VAGVEQARSSSEPTKPLVPVTRVGIPVMMTCLRLGHGVAIRTRRGSSRAGHAPGAAENAANTGNIGVIVTRK
jgi:hypothetical protein